MTSLSQKFRRGRSGLTLIELLIVCFIIVLFVAVAAPLMRPNSDDRKIREAARMLNAYFAEAKAMAAQRAKNVALVFDRSGNEGAQDPNIVTRLYLAESPPTYSGDVQGAQVGVWWEPPLPNPPPQPVVQGLTPLAINGNVPHLLTLDFQWPIANSMVDVITLSYMRSPPQAGDRVPFTLRLGTTPGSPTTSGPWYRGMAVYQPGIGIPGRNLQYFIIAEYGQPWYSHIPNPVPSPYPPPPPYPNPPPPYPPQPITTVFQMNFPPQNTSASNLELPTGTCVDLQFSGYQFYDYSPPPVDPRQPEPFTSTTYYPPAYAAPATPAGTQFWPPLPNPSPGSLPPLYIVFSPGGEIEYVLGHNINHRPTRMSFLVGTSAKAIDGSIYSDPTLLTSNLNDRTCQWVTVNARSGYVSTADNAGFDGPVAMPVLPNDPTYKGTAVGRARAMASALNTKGGR